MPDDIRKYTKRDRYCGTPYTAVIWHPDGGQAFIRSLQVGEYPPMDGPAENFETVEAAWEAAQRLAADDIEA